MKIQNFCEKCGKHIEIEWSGGPLIASGLRDTKEAICHKCDPQSNWMVEEFEQK